MPRRNRCSPVHDVIHAVQAVVVPACDLTAVHLWASCDTSRSLSDRRTAEQKPVPVKHRSTAKNSLAAA